MTYQLPNSILRKMNYFSDQKGIIRRYINEREGWDKHLENTRNYIIDTLPVKSHDTVIILGSGWLLDVPVEYLAGNFKKVILVDIFHPRQIKHKVRKFTNIELRSADISGGVVQEVYELVKNYRRKRIRKDLRDLIFTGYRSEEQAAYIISLNILNQLDILLVDYMKRFSIYGDEELDYFRGRIQKSHIDSLIPGSSCIITDNEEEIQRMNGAPDAKRKLVYTDLPRGKHVKTWQWDFDLSGSYHAGKRTIFNVIAMELQVIKNTN